METSAVQKQRQRKDILQGMIDISTDITAGSGSINCIEWSLNLPLTPSPSSPRCIRVRVPDHYREFSFVVALLRSTLKQTVGSICHALQSLATGVMTLPSEGGSYYWYC